MESKRARKVKPKMPSTPAWPRIPFSFSTSTIDAAVAAEFSPDVKEHLPAISKPAKLLDLVLKAIEVTGTTKKGASFLAIKKWIFDNREGDQDRMLVHIKKAMHKGIESGLIGRAPASETCRGLTGSFQLIKKESKEQPKADPKDISKKKPSKTTSPTTATLPERKAVAAFLPKRQAVVTPLPKRKAVATPLPKRKIVVTPFPKRKAVAAPKIQKKPLTKTLSENIVSTKEKNTAGPSQAKKPVTKTRSDGELIKQNLKSGKRIAMGFIENNNDPGKKVREVKENRPKTKPEAKSKQKPPAKVAPSAVGKIPQKKQHSAKLEKFQQDFSDSELHQSSIQHRSMKSHSSDTEVEVAKKTDPLNKRKKKT